VSSTSSQLSGERVEAFGVECAGLQMPDEGPHMSVEVADVGLLGAPLDVERLQVAVEQLVDRGAGPWVPFLVDLVEEPRAGCFCIFQARGPGGMTSTRS
jgi:hypothetical protein